MHGTILWRYLAALGAVAAFVWVFGPGWVEGYPPAFPDSSSYLEPADAGPLSIEIWFGQRPPAYPLLLWLVGPSPRAVVVTQAAVAFAAWTWLGVTVWGLVRSRWVAAAAIVVLVLVGLQSRWMFWHGAILTESLSGSLAVAGTAAWWRWFSRPDPFRLALAVGITGSWMLLRDSNAVTFVVVALPAMLVLAVLERRRSGPRRRGMTLALAGLVAVAAFSLVGQFSSNRGETSFHNNVGLRWLPDDDMRSWMEARGMPVSEALEERAGKDAWADGEAFLRSPFLADYRAWADGRGRAAAAASFVARADWYLERLWRDLPVVLGSDHHAYDTYELHQRLPERPLGSLTPAGSRPAFVGWSLALVAAAVIVARRRRRLAWLIPFWSIPVVADFYLTYVADAIEVGRHLVGPMLRFEVVAVVSVAVALDAWADPPGVDDADRAGADADADQVPERVVEHADAAG